MICPTIPKVEYCVTSSISGLVKDGHSDKVLCTLTPNCQCRFVAISSTIQIPDSGVEITGPVLPSVHAELYERTSVWDEKTPVTVQSGKVFKIQTDKHTVELNIFAQGNNEITMQEMRVLYTPSAARTIPLLAVPEGVTLHWAGDAEPTWEAGNDYVIQLLQTSPTRIEARLFNAPQGAKLPQGMTQQMLDNFAGVIWDSNTDLPVYIRFNTLTNGRYLFYNIHAPKSEKDNLEAVFKNETFDSLEQAGYMFNGLIQGSGSTVMHFAFRFPCVTFNHLVDAAAMFAGLGVELNPDVTFSELVNAEGMFQNSLPPNGFYLPNATFEKTTSIGSLFDATTGYSAYEDDKIYLPNAVFGAVTGAYRAFGGRRNIFIPKATFENCTAMWRTFDGAYFAEGGFPAQLNLQKLTDARSTFILREGHYLSVDNLKTIVYGPKSGGQYRTNQEEEPTGVGLNDYRIVGSDGKFVQTDDTSKPGYPYTYPDWWAPISKPFGLRMTEADEAAAEEVLTHMRQRGWLPSISH